MLNLNNLVNKNHNNLFANIILLKQFQKKNKNKHIQHLCKFIISCYII